MITQAELKEHLYYHPGSGDFVRIRRGARGVNFVGQQAGTADPRGYIVVEVKRRSYYGHQLAWLYVHGQWPKEIDHINRDKSDNRIANLRDVPHGWNVCNKPSRSKAGFMGVVERRYGRRYHAQIKINGYMQHLGAFATAEEAAAAYLKVVPDAR